MQYRLLNYLIMVMIPFWGLTQPGFVHYSIKNGLTQNAVTAIFKDSKGFVWMGTQDGLNRFDGLTFKHFKHNSVDTTTVSDQYITAIAEDGSGNLWIGTRNGLNKYDAISGKFERIHPDPSRKKVIQYAFDQIILMEAGNLAIVVEGQVFIWNHLQKTFKKLTNHSYSPSIFTANQLGIWKYNEGSFSLYNSISGRLIKTIQRDRSLKIAPKSVRIFADNLHAIWVVDESNEAKPVIKKFDTQKLIWISDSIVLNNKISQISFDKNNHAWVASLSGIIHINPDLRIIPWSSSQLPEPLNQLNAVLCSFHDNAGLIWIGFANNGAVSYNTEATAYDLLQPIQKRETVFAYAQDILGNEWIAAVSGLYKSEAASQSIKRVLNKKVRALAVGRNGMIWAAIENEGLFMIDKSQKIKMVANVQNGLLPDNTIFHLNANLENNQLFIATKSGLVKLAMENTKEVVYYSANKGLPIAGSYILHSFTDSKKRLWISTNGGLTVLNSEGKKFFEYKTDTDQSPYIKRTIVTGCTEDNNGNIWIATLSNGIYKWNNQQFTHYNQTNGLSGNVVSGIVADLYNRIWVATTTGMNVFDQTTNQFFAITEQNGIPASDYLLASFTKNARGKLMAGSSEGLVVINPEMVNPVNKKLNCFVTDASINYATVPIKNEYVLLSDDKSISFEISAPSFINSDKIVYQYRCVGLIDSWVSMQSNNRRISFTNLPFKRLKLEFRAAENIAQINTAIIGNIYISRTPPLWQNIYFLVPFILGMAILVFLFIRSLTQRKINEQLQKAAIEKTIYKERERISRDLHDHLGAYASAIKSNIVQLEKKGNNTNDTIHQLKGNAEDMVNALRETIWVMQYQQISLTSLSDRFKNLINRIAPNYPDIQIDVKETVEVEKNVSPGESIHLLRIMQEALTNALKHSQCTHILVEILIGHQGKVIIEDNGIGFDLSSGSTGYGLQNMKDRALEAGLVVQIESNKGLGTRICLLF